MTAGENASFCRKIFRLHLISQWGCTSAGFFPDFSPRFLYSRFPDSGVNNVSKPTGESCVCHWCWQLDLKEAKQDIWEPWLSPSYLWSPVLALIWCQVSQMFHLFQTNLPLTKFSSFSVALTWLSRQYDHCSSGQILKHVNHNCPTWSWLKKQAF